MPNAASAESQPTPPAMAQTMAKAMTASTATLGMRRSLTSLNDAQASTPVSAAATAYCTISGSCTRGGPLSRRQGAGHLEVGRGARVVLAAGLHRLGEEVFGLGVVSAQHGREAGVVQPRRLVRGRAAGERAV